MDVLAGRKTAGHVQGAVWVGGHPKEQATFARVSGYVEQVAQARICVSMLMLLFTLQTSRSQVALLPINQSKQFTVSDLQAPSTFWTWLHWPA